jgi:serine/threonine protein phosphatase 1
MTPHPDFGGAVSAQHRHLALEDYDDAYVVGDVHGCLGALQRLLDRIDVGPDDLVVFVGDLVRKGPDSAGVVDLVRARENFHSVRGNNEQKLVDGRKDDAGLDDDQRAYLADLPLAISWDGGLVVHGGVDPHQPLAEHAPDTLLTMRRVDTGQHWWEVYRGHPTVYFGHTVHEGPVVRPNAIGLDTGCVYGGELTAYDVHADRFVTVDQREDHEFRARSNFLAPGNA